MANKMDATYLRDAATWVMAELVRVFHGVLPSEAQQSVDALVERRHPLIWEYDGVKRILAPDMRAKDKILVLLHSSPNGHALADLKDWIKYEAKFRDRVIDPLADDLLIELTKNGAHAVITPLGIQRVEKNLLLVK